MSAPSTPAPLPSSSTAPAQPHPQIPILGGQQSTAPGAQLPTLTNTHIRSVADAQKLFYAVQIGLLPKVERRLDAVERKRLQPGDVYVWEERGSGPGFVAQGASAAATAPKHDAVDSSGTPQGYEVGIERWTEGLSWSASRIRDDFLIYFENIKKKEKGVDRDGARARSLENQVLRDGERDMYIKQTYSVLRNDVNGDDGASTAAGSSEGKKEVKKKPRKWHLNAYFTKSTEGNLNTIDSIPWLRDLQVPDGLFTSARQSKKSSSAAASASLPTSTHTPAAGPATKTEAPPHDDERAAKRGRTREGPSVQRTYAPFPVGESRRHHTQQHQRPVAPAPPPPPPPPLPPGVMPPPQMQMQTVRLSPIDTGVMPGAGPVSGGVSMSTMGMFNMHLDEGAFAPPPPPQHHEQQQQQMPDAFMFDPSFDAQLAQQFLIGGEYGQFGYESTPFSPSFASEYSGSGSSGGSSRGASVSSGSGSGRGVSLSRMSAGAWSPRYVKTEFSELGNALGMAPPLAPLAQEGGGGGGGGERGEEEDEEDLSGYLPMPPLPLHTETDAPPRAAAALRARAPAPVAPAPVFVEPAYAPSTSSELAAALEMPTLPLVPAVPQSPLAPAPSVSPAVGPRRALAPLHQLQRNHPYRRFPMDDRALRMLGPGPGAESVRGV